MGKAKSTWGFLNNENVRDSQIQKILKFSQFFKNVRNLYNISITKKLKILKMF